MYCDFFDEFQYNFGSLQYFILTSVDDVDEICRVNVDKISFACQINTTSYDIF